jgi:hypothetical protein
MLYDQIRIGLAPWIRIRNMVKSCIRIGIETVADSQQLEWPYLLNLQINKLT